MSVEIAIRLLLFVCLSILVSSASIEELDSEAVLKIVDGAVGNPHHTPALIEFYAPWCSHCKKLDPILKDLADYIGDDTHIKLVKVNGPRNRDCAQRLNATTYPTIVYVKDGHFGKYSGARSFDALKEFVDRVKLPTYSMVNPSDDLWSVASSNNMDNISFALFLPCRDDNDRDCMASFATEVKSFDATALQLSMQASFLLVFDMTLDVRRSVGIDSDRNSVKYCKLDLSARSLKPFCISEPAVLRSSSMLSQQTQDHNYPLISIMDNHNFHRLANLNATMLLAVLDIETAYSHRVIDILEVVAKDFESRHPEYKLVLGILDGTKYYSFCKLHGAFAPSLLVIEHETERHAVVELANLNADNLKTKIRSVILQIFEGTLSMQLTEPAPSLWAKISSRFRRYMPWSILLVFAPIVFVVLSLLSPKPKPKQH